MEKFFWADQIAEKIIKERKNKKIYVCASGITPSGTIHIGNFREVITTDLVVKALEKRGKKVRFIYSWDDFDIFRKVPKNVPKTYEKYVGMPVSEVPSPFEKNKSYAEHFEEEFEDSLKQVGIKPEFIKQHLMHKKHKYSNLIKIALEKRKEIIEILNKYRKEALEEDWFPLTIYCEECKKDFTKVLNVENYDIEYECKCGFKNKVDYRKEGFVKLSWRVDWPARWKYEEVDFEPSGIDHDVQGGSRMTGHEIAKKVFGIEPPLPQTYEWVKIKGGTVFSSSTGNAVSLNDAGEIYESEVLRYLFVGTRPNKAFQISFDNDVIKIYDDFDSLEKKYYENKATPQEKRVYELSRLKITKENPKRTSFRHLITLVQIGKISELNKYDQKRAKNVSNWLEKHGSEMHFKVQDKIKTELNEKEKKALVELREILKKKDYGEKELFNEFYNICEKTGISNKEFFSIAYKVIIKKSKGPRLADLILAIGKEKVIKLLNQIK